MKEIPTEKCRCGKAIHRRSLRCKSCYYTDRKSVRVSPATQFKKGVSSWNKSRKWSIAIKKKMSTSAIGKHVGSENAAWKDGRMSNPLYVVWSKTQNQRMRRANGGSHTFEEWETLVNFCGRRCLSCFRKEPEIKLTLDHIVPVSKGGTDNISNLQPLCQRCNIRKFTKTKDYLQEQLLAVTYALPNFCVKQSEGVV